MEEKKLIVTRGCLFLTFLCSILLCRLHGIKCCFCAFCQLNAETTLKIARHMLNFLLLITAVFYEASCATSYILKICGQGPAFFGVRGESVVMGVGW